MSSHQKLHQFVTREYTSLVQRLNQFCQQGVHLFVTRDCSTLVTRDSAIVVTRFYTSFVIRDYTSFATGDHNSFATGGYFGFFHQYLHDSGYTRYYIIFLPDIAPVLRGGV